MSMKCIIKWNVYIQNVGTLCAIEGDNQTVRSDFRCDDSYRFVLIMCAFWGTTK